MNVSMQDAFNLGWKLASVIRGQATPALLHTYSAERQAVAQELIDFDRTFARMFSATPRQAGTSGTPEPPRPINRRSSLPSQPTRGLPGPSLSACASIPCR